MLYLKKYRLLAGILLLTITLIIFSLPAKLFQEATSTVILSSGGELSGAKIAADGQWRFPQLDSVPEKFKYAILLFEDRFFYKHPGINPYSLGRALIKNIKAGRIVSGGSTISMQTIRLSRKNKNRTIWEKIVEIYLSLGLELKYSKDEILKLYASNAPFGGNVIGLEAAAWRYFNRDPWALSWAESATLAVLPNAPALVHPGKNREILELKRNNLLKKLFLHGYIDTLSYELSLTEPIPEKPAVLPSLAYHLLEQANRQYPGTKVKTSLDHKMQEAVNQIVQRNKEKIYANHIHNLACLVVHNSTGNILAYVGNLRNNEHPEYGGDNDMILAARSSGSILKPLLFAFMLDRGDILPGTLIPDIPTRYQDFNPKNYDRGYDGVVPAKRALERSLNVPAVRMLRDYGVERFYSDLKAIGMSTLTKGSDHYGLSLILGGAEVTLLDIAGIYSSMVRVLNNYTLSDSKYFNSDYYKPVWIEGNNEYPDFSGLEHGLLGAGAIYLTFNSLLEVNRPESETGWKDFYSSKRIAWKTGTSFGFRDAWAVGITPEYVVAVWVGNASGEGRPGLSGIEMAAPLMFEIYNVLPSTSWFEIPYDDLLKAEVCTKSGHLAGINCPEKDSVYLCLAGLHSTACPYHKIIHLSEDKNYRVNASCYEPLKMQHLPWFILPPLQEYYFRFKDPSYQLLPPMMKNCADDEATEYMQLIYPEKGAAIYIPFELEGNRGRLICEAAHRYADKKIFWHLDNEYIGQSSHIHQMPVLSGKGSHLLTLVDEDGHSLSVSFELLDRK